MNDWIALITDQHFGVRNNSQVFLDYYFKFYDNVFFPKLEEYNISEIIDLGDTFDKRKSIDFNILDQVKNRYFKKLLDREKTVHSIVGNHTAYYKNTNRVNTLNLLLKDFENIVIYEDPEVARINEKNVLLMPWINEENKDIAFDLLQQKHEYCFGHLEINGFEMYSGLIHHNGDYDSQLFYNVENVFSGHFHHRSKKGNIMYLGNPYQLTWGDYGDVRGFHMLNFKTGELRFIENPYNMFHTINYNDKTVLSETEQYKDSYVKVINKKKGSSTRFETFIKNLLKSNPIDVIIIENENIFESIHEDENFEEENTTELCRSTVRKFVEENEISNGIKIEDKLLNLLHKAESEEV